MDRANDRVVSLRVLLWSGMVLTVRFIEYLPDGEPVVIAGGVQLPVLIRKAAPGIPVHKACIVLAQLPA